MNIAKMADRPAPDRPAIVRVQVVRTNVELRQHLETWARLARRAVEPNVYYEPGPFMAAVDHLRPDHRLTAVLVYATSDGTGDAAGSLIGFIPFEKTKSRRSRLFDRFELFTHLYCFLSTPLIDRGFVDEAIEALVDWMSTNSDGTRLFDLKNLGVDGPVWAALEACLARRGLPARLHAWHERAVFRPKASASEFLRRSLAPKRRKELRRQRNRLNERGVVGIRAFQGDDLAEAWITQFLQLEASGWKAKEKVDETFSATGARRRFFGALVHAAEGNDTLLMQSLDLDGRPIALKCSFRSAGTPEQAFAFKIAYDESFSSYSPGVQLEIEHLRILHGIEPAVAWMDSCAKADHPMINRIWRDRRKIGRVLACGPGLLSRVVLKVFIWRISGR